LLYLVLIKQNPSLEFDLTASFDSVRSFICGFSVLATWFLKLKA